jgi:TolB-like protein/Tfp pilus assembly protein PilF
MATVWEDVKSRKIFKVATVYAAVTWGIIQIADILLPVLRYPEWVMSSMVLIAFSGFPIALIIGWMLDIKHERFAIASANEELRTTRSVKDRAIEFSIILLFGMTAAFLYWNSASQPVGAQIEPLPSISKLTSPQKEQKTIAVLPFASFGSSEEDEFFADGLSEELLNVLARNKSLRVAARTSSFQYKNQSLNIRKIARELGVQYILEGSVRRSGELIRITAQLIKADEDVHIFSSTWDKDTTNVFKVQDEIAQSVLETLEIKLLGKSDVASSNIGTEDIVAFSEYSRGVAYIRNRSKDDFVKAIEHLEKAINLDPNYAQAYAMLAEAYLLQSSYSLIESAQAIELAQPYIEKSLELNRESAEGHAVMGLMAWQMSFDKKHMQADPKKLAKAKFHLNRAIEINPSNAEAYMWYGSILQDEGFVKDGSALYKKAFEIDPQAAVVGYNYGIDLMSRGKYEESMNVFNVVVRNNPNYANAYAIAGEVSMAVGQLDQAYKLYQRIGELSGDQQEWLARAHNILIPLGYFEQAQENLNRLKQSTNMKMQKGLPYMQAKLWAAQSEFEQLNLWVDSLDENSDNWVDRFWRGTVALHEQQWEYAINDLEASLSLLRENDKRGKNRMEIEIQLYLATAYKALGNNLQTESYLTGAQDRIQYMESNEFVSPHLMRYNQATIAAIGGDTLKALGLLRQAIQEGFVDVWQVKIDPAFEPLRDDPTYQAILREFDAKMRLMKLNLPELENKLASVI